MMEPKIANLTIKEFRAFRELKIEGLGRVNLITGRNNTGKSSVLEALQILASNASPSVICEILAAREESAGKSDESAWTLGLEASFPSLALFHNYPEFQARLEEMEILSSGCSQSFQLCLRIGCLGEIRNHDGSRELVPLAPYQLGQNGVLPGLTIKSDGKEHTLMGDFLRLYGFHDRPNRQDFQHNPNMVYMFVGPYVGKQTDTLGNLWDDTVLSDRQDHVLEALRILDPAISAVSMIGGGGARPNRTAVVRSRSFSRPVPLRSFGDGLNRLFGIILSLVNAKDGLLLIDEFENGMHHTVQTDAWRAVFKLAARLDIQVVATSHSWDAVEAFQKAASESDEEGVLIRLSRKGEDIIPTLFREKELAIATRDRIEVR